MSQQEYKRAFLDYYQKNEIVPVNQDIQDIGKHYARRAGLYRQLGIVPSFIRNRYILEVGPGTGHNALYTNSLAPKKFTLLDGNPESIITAKKTLAAKFDDISHLEFIESDLMTFQSETEYDFVFCEGTIPGQNAPSKFTESLAEFVKPGGMLVITCCDKVSILADLLRKVSAAIILNSDLECTPQNVEKLRAFCQKSMNNLHGMSRELDDWIYDVILHPLVGELFSIEEAIDTLKSGFDVYYSSPQFTTDWRWYKDLTEPDIFNTPFIEQYKANIHNLLDYRYQLPPIPLETANEIQHICGKVFENSESIFKRGISQSDLTRLSESIAALSSYTSVLHQNTINALEEFNHSIRGYLSNGEFNIQMPFFEQWFSRGQQYLSLVRRPQDYSY